MKQTNQVIRFKLLGVQLIHSTIGQMYVNSAALCSLQCEELDYGCSKIALLHCGNIQYCEKLGKRSFGTGSRQP